VMASHRASELRKAARSIAEAAGEVGIELGSAPREPLGETYAPGLDEDLIAWDAPELPDWVGTLRPVEPEPAPARSRVAAAARESARARARERFAGWGPADEISWESERKRADRDQAGSEPVPFPVPDLSDWDETGLERAA